MKMTRAEYQQQATPCCGRKPIIYMRTHRQFCPRCDRAYALDTEVQVDNWAWKKNGDGEWSATYPNSDAAKQPGRQR